MNANLNYFSISKILFSFLIILNYFFYILFNTKFFFPFFFIFIIILFFFLLFKIFFSNRILFYFFIILLIISLGSAVQVWDARSIFMFNAKRIFFEKNFIQYLSSFGFVNTYPILYPVLAATINSSFSYWSEIVPKISILFLSFVPLLSIYEQLLTRKIQLLFTFLFVLIFEHRILNGDCDVLIALYFVNIAILINMIVKKSFQGRGVYLLYIELILNSTIFLLTKPQSWSLFLALVISLLIIMIINNIKISKIFLILFIIFISTIPAYHWKLITLTNYPYLLSSDISLNALKDSLATPSIFFKKLFYILGELLIQKSSLIISIFLTFATVSTSFFSLDINTKKKLRSSLLIILFSSSVLYFFSLILLYMSSSVDLETSLKFTSDRYIVPINMSLLLLGFIVLNKLKK